MAGGQGFIKSYIHRITIGDILDIHAKFHGEVEETIDEIIKLGRASTKTEAIRLAILDYRHHHIREEAGESLEFTAHANRDIWEDKNEDKVWRKYLKGGKE
jgi:hypothetical protein